MFPLDTPLSKAGMGLLAIAHPKRFGILPDPPWQLAKSGGVDEARGR